MAEFKDHYDNYYDYLLPIEGSDNSIYVSLGFEFNSFNNGDLYRSAKIPKGWSKKHDRDCWYKLLDDKNRKRVTIFEAKEGTPFMYPERRFSLGKEMDLTSVTFIAYDNAIVDGAVSINLFSSRAVLPDRRRFQEIYENKLKDLETNNNPAKKWLNDNFPKWDDFDSYWDLGSITV